MHGPDPFVTSHVVIHDARELIRRSKALLARLVADAHERERHRAHWRELRDGTIQST